MDGRDIPLVEVEVKINHARMMLRQAIIDHENKIGQYLIEQLEAKMTLEYLEQVLQKAMADVIPRAAERAIENVVSNVMWSDGLREKLAERVGVFVKRAVRDMGFGYPAPRTRLWRKIRRGVNSLLHRGK